MSTATGGRPPSGRVTFSALPGAVAQTRSTGRSIAPPEYQANTSFLPAIKPKLIKMNPVVRQKAKDTEIDFLREFYRSAGGEKWARQENWFRERNGKTVPFEEWEGLRGVDVGKLGEVQFQRCLSELLLGGNGLEGVVSVLR